VVEMLDRLMGIALGAFMAAGLIYLAVQLIESIAAALIVIAAAIGGLLLAGFVVSWLWRRHRMDRW
jgi:hypothetical protein